MNNGLGLWQGKFTERFSTEVLQQLQMPRKTIAFMLGIPYSTYDKYLRGEATFPPDLVKPLFVITGDHRVVEFFTPDGYVLKPKNGTRPAKSITDNALKLGSVVGDYHGQLRKAKEDGVIDDREKDALHRTLMDKVIPAAMEGAAVLDSGRNGTGNGNGEGAQS